MNPPRSLRSLPPEGGEWRGSKPANAGLDATSASSVSLLAQALLGAARRGA